VNRLADASQLKAPMFTLTLQRDDPTNQSSNAGVMTLGGLPSGISNNSLTWVPVTHYPTNVSLFSQFQNFQPSQMLVDAVMQIIPSTPFIWEVPIDGLFINGQLQQNSSNLEFPLTALFDS